MVARGFVTLFMALLILIFAACGVFGKSSGRLERTAWLLTDAVLLSAVYFMWV